MKNNRHFALLAFLALLACRGGPEKQARPAPPVPETAPIVEEQAPAQPPAFQWTATPRLEDIPAGPIRGEIDGRPFEARWVAVQPDTDKSWRISVAEGPPFGGDLGLFHEARYGAVFLTDPPPAAGKRYERAMALDEKGFLHLGDTPKAADHGNWHSECASVVELTAWEARDWDPKGQMGQVAGKASGRLALTCRERDGVKASWLAGEFRDAPVRYMGVPWWVPKDVQQKFLGPRRPPTTP